MSIHWLLHFGNFQKTSLLHLVCQSRTGLPVPEDCSSPPWWPILFLHCTAQRRNTFEKVEKHCTAQQRNTFEKVEKYCTAQWRNTFEKVEKYSVGSLPCGAFSCTAVQTNWPTFQGGTTSCLEIVIIVILLNN